MKKFLLTGIVAVAFCSVSFGQFYIRMAGGYSWPGLVKTGTISGFQPYFIPASANPLDPIEKAKVLDPAYASIVPLSNVTIKGDFTAPFGGTFVQDSVNPSTNKPIRDSYARGGSIGWAFGYKINKWIGVELGFNYLWSATIKSLQTYDNQSVLGKNTQITTSTKSSGLSMAPSIVLYGANKSKFTPYARLGIMLPLAGKTTHDINVISPNAVFGTYDLKSNLFIETKSTVSVGFQGALGISYQPLKFMNIWAELNGVSLTVRAQEATLTKYTVDTKENSSGTKTSADLIAGTGSIPAILGSVNKLSNYSKVISFTDVLSSSDNTEDFGKKRDATKSGQAGYVDESKNHQKLRVAAPFDAFGFSVGVTFLLSKETLTGNKKTK